MQWLYKFPVAWLWASSNNNDYYNIITIIVIFLSTKNKFVLLKSLRERRFGIDR